MFSNYYIIKIVIYISIIVLNNNSKYSFMTNYYGVSFTYTLNILFFQISVNYVV